MCVSPKAGRSYNDKSYVVCSDKRGAIFVIGRRYTPELVLTFTTFWRNMGGSRQKPEDSLETCHQ